MGQTLPRGRVAAIVGCILIGLWAAPVWAQATGTLEASNQAVQNESVTVAKVTLSQDGWVVAAVDEGGQPGAVIGKTTVKSGTASNVVIKLTKAVPVGGKIWLRLHVDAGKVGTFEFPGADAPLLVSGKPVAQPITLTAAAAPTSAAPVAPTPAVMPGTGGDQGALWLLFVAAALVVLGTTLLRVRRV